MSISKFNAAFTLTVLRDFTSVVGLHGWYTPDQEFEKLFYTSVCVCECVSLSFLFFPRASERRVLLIVEVCHRIFSSHLLIFTSSHHHIFSHLLTSSHISKSSHLHIFSSSHLLTSSHLHIFSSSHLLTSSHLHIFSSSHLLTSSHLHIFSSSHLLSLALFSLLLSYFSL